MAELQKWVHVNPGTIDNYVIPLIYPSKYGFCWYKPAGFVLTWRYRVSELSTLSQICATDSSFLYYLGLVEAIVHFQTSAENP